MHKRILALSSSRVGQSGFLEMAAPLIDEFLGKRHLEIAFIPFASVENDYEQYTAMVQQALAPLSLNVRAVLPGNAAAVINGSEVIMTGGGNTFKLLHDLYELDIVATIRDKVDYGTAYIGWSAGANITGLTLSTTNDMPIIKPADFKALSFFPFQINPHYINQKLEGHNGETRDQRLSEFILLNPGIPVVALPEGTGLRLEGNSLTLTGENGAVLFAGDEGTRKPVKREIAAGSDLSYLL